MVTEGLMNEKEVVENLQTDRSSVECDLILRRN